MSATLLKALVACVPVSVLLLWSLASFLQDKAVPSFLQLLGAACLVMVVLTHLSEALHLFVFMHWGSPHSVGHYLDFASALLGLTLFPIGSVFRILTKRHTHQRSATS